MDKNKLKEKFIRGNKKAFDRIYHDYSKAMYSVCLRYTNNTDQAADILQDAFIKIYEKRNLFNPELSLGAWIKRIVINEAINHYRVNKRFQFVEDDNYFDEEEAPVEIAEETNLKEILLDTLRELPEGYRTVFNMYVFDNLKHQEIADYLGVSINTSKTQLAKARKMIQRKLEEKNITRINIINEQGVSKY
ncbi:MAG: RNA polymerase sigma factor [Flavobacteriales bacterium]|nr:RNA polymerase sigma factor [Flavobacteriales bacterium]